MAFCTTCNTTKEDSEFSFRNKQLGLRASKCKECHKVYAKEHYKQNKVDYIRRAKTNTPKYVAQARAYVDGYLKSHPCIDCGESRIPCLDFDHIRGKTYSISKMVFNSRSVESLQKEIDLCEVRCSNCHRMRHFVKRGGVVERQTR